MSLKKIDGIEIEEEAFKKNQTEWKIQRIGIIVMAIIVISALLGFMGLGLFSNATVSDSNNIMTIHYVRFNRSYDNHVIQVEINASYLTPTTKIIPISLNQAFLDKSIIEQIHPKPAYEEINANKTVFYFPVKNNKNNIKINFWIEPQQAGFNHGEIGILDGPSLTFNQVIYP